MDLGLASCAFAAPPVVEPATSGTSGGATDEGKGEAKEEEAKEEEAKEEDDPIELFDDSNLVEGLSDFAQHSKPCRQSISIICMLPPTRKCFGFIPRLMNSSVVRAAQS